MILHRFLANTRATASVEFALLVPLLIILLFGGTEAGHFVWTQHKLAEAVRDGARYASRLKVNGDGGVCDGATSTISQSDEDAVKLITRTGQLDDAAARPVVPGWTDAQVNVEVFCESFVDTGIYNDLNAAGPIVRVSATDVTYPSMFNGLGGRLPRSVRLNARSNAAVIGL